MHNVICIIQNRAVLLRRIYKFSAMNPFVIMGQIPSEYFCDRETETKRIVREIVGQSANILLLSQRRLGKTSLISHCFAQKEIADSFYTFYFDILHTSSFQEFTYEFGKQVFEQLATKGRKTLASLVQAIKSVQPKFGIDPLTRMPTFALELGSITQPEYTLSEIFSFLEKADKPCVVAIDEFQRIARYPEKNIEALLLGKIQHLGNTHFIFAGSQRHILSEMFNSYNQPFYNSTSSVTLDAIRPDIYADFAVRLFSEYDKRIDASLISRLYALLDGNTFCLQKILHIAFDNTAQNQYCTVDILHDAINEVLADNDRTYRESLARMSTNQKAVLYAIAIDRVAKQITGTDFLRRHQLGSASSVQAAVRILLENDWITTSEKTYSVSDKFFELWLRANSGYPSVV